MTKLNKARQLMEQNLAHPRESVADLVNPHLVQPKSDREAESLTEVFLSHGKKLLPIPKTVRAYERRIGSKRPGRPKAPISLTRLLREVLSENPSEALEIIEAHIRKGKEGDVRAITELYDRVDGPVANKQTPGEMPVNIIFVPYDALKQKDARPIEIEGEFQLISENIDS